MVRVVTRLPGQPSTVGALCAICRQRAAQYTCPACNLRYCSSDCYRDVAHDTCSESFYRKSLIEDIEAAPGRTMEEKKAMMDILRRVDGPDDFDGPTAEDDAEELESRNLARKLEKVNLDALTADELASMLSPAQMKDFQAVLKDPQKAAALLSGAALHQEPWWELEEDAVALELPKDVPKVSTGVQLGYNLVAILLGYARTIRVMGLYNLASAQAERQQIVMLLRQLLPVLFVNSMLVLQSLDEAIAYVLSRADIELGYEERRLLFIDVSALLQVRLISDVAAPDLTYDRAAHSLMDLHATLTGQARRKVLFYLGVIGKAPELKGTADALRLLASSASPEANGKNDGETGIHQFDIHEVGEEHVKKRPLIEEVG